MTTNACAVRKPIQDRIANFSTTLAIIIALAMASSGVRAEEPAPATPDAPSQSDVDTGHRDLDKMTMPRAAPGLEWWRDIITRFPGCRALTDDCQSCASEGDKLTCSNPGIACVRGEWHCAATAKDPPSSQ